MNAEQRRLAVMLELEKASRPVSAGSLASKFNVSRQVIVGDIALLRASGASIAASPRGYVLTMESSAYERSIACCHSAEDTEEELNIIVDNGCTVKDVIVEHPIYGQLTGMLDLRSRYDVKQFIRRLNGDVAKPLSALTDGIHLHTILCPDEKAYERVLEELGGRGMLFSDNT